MPRVPGACCCLLPAPARHTQSKEGAQRPRGPRRWGASPPLTSRHSRLCHPRGHAATQACLSRHAGVPPQTRGPWVQIEHARFAALGSQPACHQDGRASGTDSLVLGRQKEERHGNIVRGSQMEAQLRRRNQELQRVRVLTGRPRLGWHHLFPPFPPLPSSVRVCGPHGPAPALLRSRARGAAYRRWAGARGTPHP